MTNPKALPTCVCGSTQFQEYQTILPLRAVTSGGGTTYSSNREVWVRECQQCSQVTLWSKKSGT
jgi:hypothetical protein